MKQNPGNVALGKDKEMIKALKNIFHAYERTPVKIKPKYVVESGTYHGLGTTYNTVFTIRRNVPHYPSNITFFTIEADYGNFKKARYNWRNEFWVKTIHGLSVDKQKALNFIETDEALLFHQNYPDILIDSQDPIPFYKAEIEGALPEFRTEDQGKHEPENNVFGRLLPLVANKCPLIILDSCGGIGWLEFQTVMEVLGQKRFYLFLHDINHVKHFRSYEYIKHFSTGGRREFKVIAEKEKEWILACHPNREGKGNPKGRGGKKKGRRKKWKWRVKVGQRAR